MISGIMNIPSKVPENFYVGDTVKWTFDHGDYSASDGWTLSYIFILLSSAQASPVTASAAPDGDAFLVTISKIESAGFSPGDYQYFGYAEKDTEKYTVDSGFCKVKPDPSAIAAGSDSRSHARIVLDAIEATLEGTATSAQMQVMIGNKMIIKYKPMELLEFRRAYQDEVDRESGSSNGSRITPRFMD